MILEVIATSLELVEAVVAGVEIPVNVIIRPHSRRFHYEESDLAVMAADILHIKRAGVAGIVIGALTKNRNVDTEAMSRLLDVAEDMDVTFHRAFDRVENQLEELKTIASFTQIKRVLTSGGLAPAPQSAGQLKKLVEKSKDMNIQIMAGHGLTADSVSSLIATTGVEEIHFGSGVRVNQSFMHPIDSDVISKIKKSFK